jgi:hypothetical protein
MSAAGEAYWLLWLEMGGCVGEEGDALIESLGNEADVCWAQMNQQDIREYGIRRHKLTIWYRTTRELVREAE